VWNIFLRMNDPKMPYLAELIFLDARNLVKSKFGKHLILKEQNYGIANIRSFLKATVRNTKPLASADAACIVIDKD